MLSKLHPDWLWPVSYDTKVLDFVFSLIIPVT